MDLATLLQQAQTPPDTTDGLILAYVVIGVIGVAYVISLILRANNLRKDIRVLSQIKGDE
ncbi:MAG: hypothetical protein GYB68_03115 [Chloroflexi bacterium]|nr:hypothetical protein [Chloroflexota bacterium]